jgi:histidine triad (HIT) family protein
VTPRGRTASSGRTPSPSDGPPASASCAFCKVVAGEVTSHVVFEDEQALAFLDHRPLFPGHALLVPRDHHETLLDLPDELVGTLFANAKLLAEAMEDGLGAEGTFVALNNRISQSVPHIHIHVVPRRRKDGLRGFFWPRQKYHDDAHAEETAAILRSAVDTLRSKTR